jgi:GAF domain-containing protein
MVLDEIRETLEMAREELGAASCTFYVRDPFWPEELRLVAMPGVRIVEPMYGFSFPPHSKRVLAKGEPEIFTSDSQSKEQLRETVKTPLDGIAPATRVLFNDFIEREGIKSSARLWHKDKDSIPKAVLFVNYTETKEFDEGCKEKIRDLLGSLVEKLPEISKELHASESGALVQAILGIFPPTYAGSKERPDDEDDEESDDEPDEEPMSLTERLESILKLLVEALGLTADKTLGTVHLYDRQTKMLSLTASYGKIGYPERAERPQSVPLGEGIISWVAIRRKALLIRDLKSSAFGRIHIPIHEGARSEVAIPIFDGKHLLGVLNLESLDPDAFPQTCVRSLWFAVNRAAEAVRLSQQANINERLTKLTGSLLELCAEAVGKRSGEFSLDQLAGLASKELQAARCGIWRYNVQDCKFELAGISPPGFQPKPPRHGGWSSIIQSLKWPIWVDLKDSGADSKIRYWNGTKWDKPALERTPPDAINPSVESDVKSLLGIPIIVQNQCIGIAWLEYESNPETHTENELMNLASGFAAYAGLVIEFSQVDIVDKDAVQTIGDKLSKQLLAPGNLDLDGFPNIEVFVKSQNYGQSRIGGDFWAARVIDEQTAGVLVGDGQGHAVQGALNMLPILAVFEAFWKDSRSVTHIMDKIMGVTKKMGVNGSAVYCVFTVIEKALWLSVTSAGHEPKLLSPDEDGFRDRAPLVIFPKGGGAEPFPREGSPARSGMLGVKLIKEPLAEARRQLSSGEVIIIYTDGLELDFNEVVAAGLPHKKKDPRTIAEAIFDEATEKRDGEPFGDDATVLVISVKK